MPEILQRLEVVGLFGTPAPRVSLYAALAHDLVIIEVEKSHTHFFPP